MLQVILALNAKRAREGLELLKNNINILDNAKYINCEEEIKEYKLKIKEYTNMLKKDDLKMPETDEILSFISICNDKVMAKFT